MEDEKVKPSVQETWWPELNVITAAEKAAKMGMVGALLCSGITLLIIFINSMKFFDAPLLDIDASSIVDVIVFAGIGFGIYKFSRIAAIAGLGLYVVGQVHAISTGQSRGSIVAAMITLFFINGVRGCFAYHRLGGGQPPRPIRNPTPVRPGPSLQAFGAPPVVQPKVVTAESRAAVPPAQIKR